MPETPNLSDIIDAEFDVRMAQVFTALPGRVEKYFPDTGTACIKPMVPVVFVSETGVRTVENLPVIQGVPVMFPGGGGHHLLFPITKGDFVLLVFASSSIDQWKFSGKDLAPKDDRHHGLHDAIAIPGLRPSSFPVPVSGNLPTTLMALQSADLRLGSTTASDPVALKSDLTAINTALTNAIAAVTLAGGVTAPPALAALNALKNALAALSFPICAQSVKAE